MALFRIAFLVKHWKTTLVANGGAETFHHSVPGCKNDDASMIENPYVIVSFVVNSLRVCYRLVMSLFLLAVGNASLCSRTHTL